MESEASITMGKETLQNSELRSYKKGTHALWQSMIMMGSRSEYGLLLVICTSINAFI